MKYLSLLICLVLIVGCGDSNKNPISGTVQIDGQAINGMLTLTPKGDPKAPSCILKVTDGNFKSEKVNIVTPGENQASFSPDDGGGQSRSMQEGQGAGRDRPYRMTITIPEGGGEGINIEFTESD